MPENTESCWKGSVYSLENPKEPFGIEYEATFRKYAINHSLGTMALTPSVCCGLGWELRMCFAKLKSSSYFVLPFGPEDSRLQFLRVVGPWCLFAPRAPRVMLAR